MPRLNAAAVDDADDADVVDEPTPDADVVEEPEVEESAREALRRTAPINNIAPALRPLAVPIASLFEDQENANSHSDRNIDDIMDSVAAHGQTKVIVVRRQTRVVVAGNGTLEAVRRLGWTEIAANVMDMTDDEATAYGIADNATGRSSAWNIPVLDRLVARLQHRGHGVVGLTTDELLTIRQNAEAYRPAQANGDGSQTWQELWQGMPEFVQEDLTSARSVVVHFRTEEDFLDFLRLVGQAAGDVRQKSIWHPKAEIGHFADKRYAAVEPNGEAGDECPS